MERETTSKTPDHANWDLGRRYRALLGAVHAPHSIDDEAIWVELTKVGQALDEARDCQRSQCLESERLDLGATGGKTSMFLGPATTGLKVTTTVRLQPIPTGIYHLLDPQKHPLMTITLENQSHEPLRVSVAGYIEGVSAKAVRTIELERMDKGQTISLLPGLLPGAARQITQVQRATLHVLVEIFGSSLSPTTWSIGSLA